MLLNGLRTAKASVKATWGLSEAWNFCARRLRPRTWARRREENRAAVGLYDAGGARPICGQELGPAAALPFGRKTLSYCGCEVIAVYNVLLALGEPRPLAEITDYFEGTGIILNGSGGTHVEAIPRFFRSCGCAAEPLYASRAREYDAAFAGAPAAVFSFWNARTLRACGRWVGVHTVCVTHAPSGGVLVQNVHGRAVRPVQYRSIADYAESCGLLPIVLIPVRRNT